MRRQRSKMIARSSFRRNQPVVAARISRRQHSNASAALRTEFAWYALRMGSWLESMRAARREPLALPDNATRYLTHDEQARTLTEILSKVAQEYPEAVRVPQ